MAGFLLCAARFLFLFLINSIIVSCGPANKLVQNVPAPLIQSALHSLNEDSPTHHTYKGGNLISAQKLEELPYTIYRLTFDLTPTCKETLESCPREACTVEVKQHEQGEITVLGESIQCMYLYPQSTQDDPLQMQENIQEQEITENVEKQMVTNQSVELDHEIQNTGDHNEKPFIAMRATSPKYCPGCPFELNPNLPGLVAFGDQVARSMDELIQNDFKHKVVDIVKVTRAVPSSSNTIQYQMLLHMGESDCLKNAIEQSHCSVQLSLPVKTCLVTFEEQPWQQSSRKITKNNCTQDTVESENNVNSFSTLNAEALVVPTPNRQEPNVEKVEALENLKQMLDNFTYATTTRVEEQEQQEVTEHPIVKVSVSNGEDDTVTQGFQDKAKEFNEFLTNFDVPIREAKSNPEVHKEEVKEEIILPKKVSSAINDPNTYRNKRGVPGGPQNKNVTDPEIQELAKKGLHKFSQNYRGTNEPIIVEIVEATHQVVSGSLYKIKVKLGTSNCQKGTTGSCQLQEGSEIQQCLFTVWSQPWIDKGSPEITIDCEPEVESDALKRKTRSIPDMNEEIEGLEKTSSAHRSKRKSNLVGAPANKDINDPEIQELTNKGLQKFSQNYTGTNEPIIVEIVEATHQVVSGSLYKIKVKVGTSNCQKGTTGSCQLQEGSEIQQCLFTVWSQPWIDKGNPEITINCEPEAESDALKRKTRSIPEMNEEIEGLEKTSSAHRSKRKPNLVGAPANKDINDPEIQELANKGLQKFSENSEGISEPIIAEIVEASQQVVSGYLYKIKVKLGTSTCPKGVKDNCLLKEGSEIKECLFTIWSQPWKDKGSPEITINCDVNARRKRSLRGNQYSQKMLKLAGDIHKENLFKNFMRDHDKVYASPEEEQKRFRIFKQNLETIQDLQKYEQGTGQYGVTMFADLTPREFKERHLGLRPELKQENEIPPAEAKIPDIELPPKFDWREYNVVTPVKDQGQCGSCWAFSVTGNVEGQYAIKHKKLLSLSEQELVDCDNLDEGCNGGEMDNAYRIIEKLGGLELEKDYPYDAKNEKCHFAQSKAKVQVVSHVNITSNETQMAQWLVQNGPISIGINANAMQFYIGGVSHPFRFLCDPNSLDHGVLIVGYGTSKYPLFHKELPYWIVKNSWGPRWGESGYYRVYRGDGTCGVNNMASSAVVA
ncbi:uncharacterized protein LOC143179865 [Calliopsis andreniformis]|uniref:uncharacterized protein LOC143179865 n=1 Tax=Calliopsis andreniformis TaxID=337506 RepID=UPI003FCD1A88